MTNRDITGMPNSVDIDPNLRVFHRNIVTVGASDLKERNSTKVLVVEVDDYKVYFAPDKVIITKDDKYAF